MQAIFGEETVRDSDSAVTTNSSENSVHIVCNNIRRVAKMESKSSAKAYIENLHRRAQDSRNPHHRRFELVSYWFLGKIIDYIFSQPLFYSLLHIALIDESGETPALDVINLYNEFDLTNLFNEKNDELQTPLHLASIYDKSLCIAKMLQFGKIL